LQQPGAVGGDVSVNDALAAVSRYFDRIDRPEQCSRRLRSDARDRESADTGPGRLHYRRTLGGGYDIRTSFRAARLARAPAEPDSALLDTRAPDSRA